MQKSFMERVAGFIVDKRYLFILIFIGLIVMSVFTSNSVRVDEDLTNYLPDDSETRQGLAIMEREFITYGDARVMVSNITYAKAEELAAMLRTIDGVKSVEVSDDPEHFKDAAALFEVTFEGEKLDNVAIQGVENVRQALSGYDTYIYTEVGNPTGIILEKEMNMVLVILVCIIILVLFLTSRSYAEVPILLITFGVAVWINKGTNFLFGEISFITNSIAAVLQLGLAIDYAIILCHHYTEERDAGHESRDAIVKALSMAIPEISASSLTTISGLLALAFMKIKIGQDMSLVLIKAIIFSMLSVFLLMPALLLLASKIIDKTRHKPFLPKITGWGRLTVKSRYIVPPIFAIIVIAAAILANHCPYVFGYSTLDTLKQNEYKLSEKKINSTFGERNQIALILPYKDYETETRLLRDLEQLEGIEKIISLAGTEARDGYTVTEGLTPRQFAELTDLDITIARAVYAAYCTQNDSFTQAVGQILDISNIDNTSVPLIEMIKFIYEQRDAYSNRIDDSMMADLEELYNDLVDGENQLHTQDYSRMILRLNLPVESEETYDYLTVIKGVIGKYYTESYFVGETAKDKDFSTAFGEDNLLISLLTILFVIAILLFTFKSAALPVLLILVIQGSIWINFSFPTIMHSNLYFLAYLIVSAIMMGANIDYAIVISNRYLQFKEKMNYKDAMVEALNMAFPTVVTSGTILAAAGVAIGLLSSENTVASIGVCLGRGTILSMLLVLGVLPQILLLGDSIVEKTSFNINRNSHLQSLKGSMRVNGHLRGYVNGFVDADIRGYVNGTVRASVDISKVEMAQDQSTGRPYAAIPETDKESIPAKTGEEGSYET